MFKGLGTTLSIPFGTKVVDVKDGLPGDLVVVNNQAHHRVKGERDELKKKLEEVDDKRPYWLWHGMIEYMSGRDCDGRHGSDIDCDQTSDCITEWCVICAAKKFKGIDAQAEHEKG